MTWGHGDKLTILLTQYLDADFKNQSSLCNLILNSRPIETPLEKWKNFTFCVMLRHLRMPPEFGEKWFLASRLQ